MKNEKNKNPQQMPKIIDQEFEVNFSSEVVNHHTNKIGEWSNIVKNPKSNSVVRHIGETSTKLMNI